MQVDDTIATIRDLPFPVVRSCHIGNNTANNWAWLSLAKNTSMVQFDHTVYGADEVCVPWMVLGDEGRIEACFKSHGESDRTWIGRHVNQFTNCRPLYSESLNYGIFARYQGQDLITFHCELGKRLCTQNNQSNLKFACSSLLESRSAVAEATSALARNRLLHFAFDRWVRCTKKGEFLMQKLRRIDYDTGGKIRLYGLNSELLYAGSIDTLNLIFFEALEAVLDRLIGGSQPAIVGYPWITLGFNYFSHVLRELSIDSKRRVFWHAGGSASAYYVNEANVVSDFHLLIGALTAAKQLPPGVRLHIVPTLCCQLAAIDAASLVALETLLDVWTSMARQTASTVDGAVQEFCNTCHPLQVAAAFAAALSPHFLKELMTVLERFNAVSQHKLPIAHTKHTARHATYNKYGICQRAVLGQQWLFPQQLRRMRWGEAELLVKLLATLTERREG